MSSKMNQIPFLSSYEIEQPYCADFSRTPALLSHQCSDDYDAGMSVSLPVLLGAAEPDVWGQ